MLLSWKLWHATFYNSLYDFPLLVRPYDAHRWQQVTPLFRKFRLALLVLGLLFILFVYPAALPMTLAVGFVLLVLFAGTVSGWVAASRIAGAIFREQEKGRYELLLLSPPGVLGVHWAIVTRYLRDDTLLRWLRWLPSGFYIFIAFPLFGLLIAILLTSVLWLFSDNPQPGFFTLFQVGMGLLIVGMLYTDYVQSVVMGILIGILLPTLALDRAENAAYTLASAGFFAFQTAFYGVCGWCGLLLANSMLFPALRAGRFLPVWGITFVLWIVMVALREVVVRWLWRTAEQRLYFDANESGIRI
jgi:hypothetical protein